MMRPSEHVNCPSSSEFVLLAHMVGLLGVVVGVTVGLVVEVIEGPETELVSCWTISSSPLLEP